MPENPVNGTATLETVSGGTTSNAVDFFPYRSGPQSDPTNGQYPVLTAPIPVDDAAPSVSCPLRRAPTAAPRSRSRPTASTTSASSACALPRASRRSARDAAAVHGQRRRSRLTRPATASAPTARSPPTRRPDEVGHVPGHGDCSRRPEPTPTPRPRRPPRRRPPRRRRPRSRRSRTAKTPDGRSRAPSVGRVRLLAALDRGQVEGPVHRERRPASSPPPRSSARARCASLTAAPFECSFSPKGSDVGGQALRLIVTDNAGSTAELTRNVVVSRFVAKLSVSGRQEVRQAGIKRTINGKVSFPSAVTQAQACTGKVR